MTKRCRSGVKEIHLQLQKMNFINHSVNYIAAMEFAALVRGEEYRFSFLNNNSVLVSCKQGDYILYKNKIWRCADDVSVEMVEELGEAIDEHVSHSKRNNRNLNVDAGPQRDR